jgi:very-short-patch-repair endonuclease
MATRQLTQRVTAAEYNAMLAGKTPGVKLPRKRSELEEELDQQIALYGLPEPETEYRFLKDRRFRFDFAWPDRKFAVEIQGGYYSNGRHNRNPIPDCKKANLAGQHGWTLLFFKPDEVENGAAVLRIQEELNNVSR